MKKLLFVLLVILPMVVTELGMVAVLFVLMKLELQELPKK